MIEIIQCVEKLNWQTIVAMFAIGWYFTRDMRISTAAFEKDIKQSLSIFEKDSKQQAQRIDRLYEMFVELLKDNKK